LVVPRINAPAARNRATTTASCGRYVAFVQQATDLAAVALGRDRRFDRDRQAVEMGRVALAYRIELPRLGAHTFGVEIGKDVELGIEARDLVDVRLGQLGN
jgi:hypothetical protein